MLIGRVAEQAGVSPRVVRHYANAGLLTAARDSNGYRRFSATDVSRVRQIRALIHLGLTVERIQKLRPCLDTNTDADTPTCPAAVGALAEQAVFIERQIATLSELHARITATIGAGFDSR